jgi:hypothetical protein
MFPKDEEEVFVWVMVDTSMTWSQSMEDTNGVTLEVQADQGIIDALDDTGQSELDPCRIFFSWAC